MTAKLQYAQSNELLDLMAFQQWQVAFSSMLMLQQASPIFLCIRSLYPNLRLSYSNFIVSEYLPKLFRAAALFTIKFIFVLLSAPHYFNFYKYLVDRLEHYLNFYFYRYRKVRYSTAVILLSYFSMYFQRKQILFSAKGWFMPERKIAPISTYLYLSFITSPIKLLFLGTGYVLTPFAAQLKGISFFIFPPINLDFSSLENQKMSLPRLSQLKSISLILVFLL